MNFAAQLFDADRIAHNAFTYQEFAELEHEARVWELEVYGKMRAKVIANGGSRFAWLDELLAAQDEADEMMEYLRSVDPLQDKSSWIQTRGHLEALRHGMLTMRALCRRHLQRGGRHRGGRHHA